MTVRALLDFLKTWIDERLDDINNARIANPEKTIAWYWLKNAGDGENFRQKDIVFECFHNFVALGQWGVTIFRVMALLRCGPRRPGSPVGYERTMRTIRMPADGGAFTPLERFVMELFRRSRRTRAASRRLNTLQTGRSDNYGDSGSPSARFGLSQEHSGYIISPHTSTSFAPMHWTNPLQFDPRDTGMCRPAPRWTRQKASRSASPNVRSI